MGKDLVMFVYMKVTDGHRKLVQDNSGPGELGDAGHELQWRACTETVYRAYRLRIDGLDQRKPDVQYTQCVRKKETAGLNLGNFLRTSRSNVRQLIGQPVYLN